jgi:hypothetical protein
MVEKLGFGLLLKEQILPQIPKLLELEENIVLENSIIIQQIH